VITLPVPLSQYNILETLYRKFLITAGLVCKMKVSPVHFSILLKRLDQENMVGKRPVSVL